MYVPFSGSSVPTEKKDFNMAIYRSRVTVWWYFKEVKQFWTALYFKLKLRLQESAVESLYIAGVSLTNFRNCVYPRIISQLFQCPPPELEAYVFHAN